MVQMFPADAHWELNDLAPRDGWGAVIAAWWWLAGRRLGRLSQSGTGIGSPGLVCRGIGLSVGQPIDGRLKSMMCWQRWIFGRPMGRPESNRLVGAFGGGHLAMMAGLRRPERVRCVVAMGAPSDLQDVEDRGESLEEVFDRDQLRSASPIHQDCEQPPPTLLVHGTLDRVVHIEQSRRHQALRPDTVELIEIRDGDHGLRWPPMAAWRARRQAIDLMVDHLDLASRGSKWKRRKKGKR